MPDRLKDKLARSNRVSEVEIRGEDFKEKEIDGRKYAEVEVSMATSGRLDRGWYDEELVFSGMDRSFMDAGNAPVYFGHNRGADRNTPRAIIGTVVGTRVAKRDDDKEVLYTTLRFALGDEDSGKAYNKIRDGLFRNVSLGWKADYARAAKGEKAVEFVESDDKREKDLLRYNYWSPREASIVGLPADSSVGFGRDEVDEIRNLNREVADMPDPVKKEVDENVGTRDDGGNPPEAPKEGERKNLTIGEIRAKAKEEFEGSRATDADVEDAIRAAKEDANGNPVTYKAVRTELWKIVSPAEDKTDRSETKERLDKNGESTRDIDGVPAERKATAFNKGGHVVNCGRFFENAREHDGDESKLRGLEGELLTEHRNQKGYALPGFKDAAVSGSARSGNGAIPVHIPHRIMEMDPNLTPWFTARLPKDRLDAFLEGQRAVITQNAVGFAYPVFDGSFFIAALREMAPLLKKVNFLPGQLYQNLVAVLETGDVAWAESPANRVGPSTGDSQGSLEFGNRIWEWTAASAFIDIQLKTLDQTNQILPAIIYASDRGLANFMDGRIIGLKSNPTNGVTGIIHYTSVPKEVASGANAKSTINYEHITKMRAKARGNNMSGAPGFVMTPGVKEGLMVSSRLAGSTGAVSDSIIVYMNGEPYIDGAHVTVDNNVPTDLVKGSTTDASAVIYGNFMDVHVGLFSEAEFLLDIFTQRGDGNVRLWMRQAWDAEPGQVNNFVVTDDADNR